MRKAEQRLWDSFKRNNKNADHKLDLTRVENIAAEGLPDVHCRTFSAECWVELKVANEPKRASTRVMGNDGLNSAQENWHIKNSHYGLKSYVLLRVNLHSGRQRLYLIPSKWAKKMNDYNMQTLNFASRASSWEAIFIMLKRT